MFFDSSSQFSSPTTPPGFIAERSPVADNSPSSPSAAVGALVRDAQRGEQAAQSELVRGYQRRVAGFVHKMIRRRCAVEDITQTVMIRMIQRLPYLREPKVFESWLFRMARNEVLDALRRIKCRVPTVEEDWDWRGLSDDCDRQAHFEISEAVTHAIACLPQPDRAIILLIIAGHTYQSIAGQTGLTAMAVKVRVHRMRLILRPRMLEALGGKVTGPGLALDGAPSRRKEKTKGHAERETTKGTRRSRAASGRGASRACRPRWK